MKRIVLLAISISFFAFSFAQKKEYQDPAYWIDLEKNNDGIPVRLTTNKGKVSYLNAPIKFISKKDDRLKAMEIVIDSIKYEAESEDRQIVFLDGKVDLSCCRNRPINMEFYNDQNSLIQFSRTDEEGNFKLKSVNGNMLEIKNYKIKINFKKLKTIDENWDERYASLERKSIPSEKKLDRLQRKELKESSYESN